MIKKIHILILSYLLSFCAITIAEPYKVAVLIPLTGSSASYGTYTKNGIDLALSKLPPEKKQLISVRYEDDQLKSANSVSIAKRLIAQNNADAIIVFGSGIGNAVAPIAEQGKRLLIAIGASDFNVVKNRKFSFLHWVPPPQEVETMIKEMIRKGYKSVGFAGSEVEGVIAIADELKKQLAQQGKSDLLSMEEYFHMNETDFQTYLTKAKNKKLDAVIACFFPGSLAAFAKQSKLLKFPGDLVGVETFEDENEVKASEGALVGKWYVNADTAVSDYEKMYFDKYAATPGLASANSYDTINIIVDGLAKGTKDNVALSDHLNTLKDYAGAAGKYSATGDHRFSLPVAIKEVTADGFKKIS